MFPPWSYRASVLHGDNDGAQGRERAKGDYAMSGYLRGRPPERQTMGLDVEQLESWAVDMGKGESPSLVLVLSGRSVAIPASAADLLARALRERALEITKRGGRERPANQP